MKAILKNFTLLYAEDDLEVRQEMSEYFGTYFKELHVTTNGKEALEIYRIHKPDVLLLDIYMPEMDGLELAKQIRQKDHKTKIVIMSAHSQEDLMLQAINSNINYYIIKPATVDKIKDMLDKISVDLIRDTKEILRFNVNIYYNLNTKQLLDGEEEVALSHKENRLLEILAKNNGRTVSMSDIMEYVWDDHMTDVSFESVKSQVSYLRKKLPNNVITNVYGIGYILKV